MPERRSKEINGSRGTLLNIDVEELSPYRPERVVALRIKGLRGGVRARVAFRARELRRVIDWLEEAHAELMEGSDDGD